MNKKDDTIQNVVIGIFGTPINRWINNFSLKDGGASLFTNGTLCVSISEERLTKHKHSTGFENAIAYCLEYSGFKEDDIDSIVLSNCCDSPFILNGSLQGILARNYTKVKIVPSHHYSHALLAAIQSGFNESLIIVADNEGNLLGNVTDYKNYWNNSLERVSFYLYKNEKLTLIDRDCFESDNIGLGDAYHYFTHYLGWNSYTQAGRVMGLSAYGDKNKYESPIWILDDNNKINTLIPNNRINKINTIEEFGLKYYKSFPKSRNYSDAITQEHMNVASWVQNELENILSKKISLLIEKTKVNNICISGGIGYNCLANRVIYDLLEVENIFIPYAPGDEGQPLGNALFNLLHENRYTEISIGNSPFLGKNYSDNEILAALRKEKGIKYTHYKNIFSITASLLVEQKIIGWFQGRSEMGSRALGNRSILADPRSFEMKEKVNKIKGREWFRPVAPSILEEFQNEYFDLDLYVPYMNIVANALPKTKLIAPAIVHNDNTSRIQTVRKTDNKIFYDLIATFYSLTKVPIIINTSFNKNGSPIVESPADAIEAFNQMNLDVLVMNNFLITK
ncbi:MAG: hypothetical protein JXA68_10565 [Ignavibacteriales bacterium]|nr:hypothetical protein [Ignavibacteriales bacterium]